MRNAIITVACLMLMGIGTTAQIVENFEGGYRVDGGLDGKGSVVGQGKDVQWRNWFNADTAIPFRIVKDADNQFLRAERKESDSAIPAAGVSFAPSTMLDVKKTIHVSFKFRFEEDTLPIDRFDTQSVRLIVLDQPFFMISFGANGVLHLYDYNGRADTPFWVKSPEGKAWQATPGMWHRLEAVIDPVDHKYRATIDGKPVPARNGSEILNLDPNVTPGTTLIRLASINWKLGKDWRAVSIDDLKIINSY